MNMTKDLKDSAEHMAGLFLETMPEESFKKFQAQKLHEQLSYYTCWVELLRSES